MMGRMGFGRLVHVEKMNMGVHFFHFFFILVNESLIGCLNPLGGLLHDGTW